MTIKWFQRFNCGFSASETSILKAFFQAIFDPRENWLQNPLSDSVSEGGLSSIFIPARGLK
ncbi:MAG: hypothetical protein ACLFT0_19935, partial [Spirulinaceae cyanobacterium]